MKTTNSKLAVKKSTLRNLTAPQLANVHGGAPSGGRPSQNPGGPIISLGSSGTSVILPSGGLPSGGLPSGGLPSGG